MTAEELIGTFQDKVNNFIDGIVFHKGTVIGVFKKACGNDDDYHLILKALTGHTSSKELTEAQWFALYHFAFPIKPEGGKWQSGHGNDELERRCKTLLRSTFSQPGQVEMTLDA